MLTKIKRKWLRRLLLCLLIVPVVVGIAVKEGGIRVWFLFTSSVETFAEIWKGESS